tara:strand:- start:2656 stop:5676 length:3021 start_codon:yes stop_codon:yes gene_type:complete
MAATIQTIQKPTKARALDASGNNNHGQIYSGRALEFDGVSDSLEGVQNINTSYGITNNITVACWIKTSSFAATQFIWNLYQNTGDGWGLRLTTSGEIEIFDDIDGGDDAYYTTNIETNTWYRIVTIMDAYEQKLYINGVLVGSGSNQGATNGSGPAGFDSYVAKLYIGRRGYTGGELHFNGAMSDFQMWDSVWTAEDILYDYNNPEQLALNRGGTSLTNSNLKAWYPINDGHRGEQSYILDAANTGLGDEKWDSDKQSGNLSGWVAYSNNEIALDGDAIKVTYVDNSGGAYLYLRDALTLDSDLTVGQTYKVTVDAKINSGSAEITYDRTGSGDLVDFGNLTTEFATYEYIFTAKHATNSDLRFNSLSSGEIAYVKNFSLKAINEKNHATTVFYGDELITNGTMEADSNWADYNSVNANVRSSTQAHSGTYSRKFTVDGSSQGIQSDTFTTVAGRTYLLSFEIYPDDATTARIAIRRGDNSDWADDTSFSGLTQDAWNTKTVTYTESAGGSGAYLVVHGHGNTSGDFYVDDVSIKEVGTATGWTDADQQPDIPQTSLQSYNQLGWHDGADDSDDKEVKTSGYGGNFGTDDFVLSYCIFKNDSKETSFFFLNSGGGTAGRYGHRIQANGDLQNYATDDASTSTGYFDVASEVIQTGKWHHIVESIDRSDNEVTVWVDGESYGSTSISASGTISTSSNISAGGAISFLNFSSQNFINGTMNEISIWKNTEFTQSDVDELYNDGKILDARKHSKEVNSSKLANYWTNDGLTLWQDKKGSAHVTTNDLTEIMLITEGVDATRDSQGFLMNRQRLTNSLNYYPDVGGGSNLNIGAQTKVSGSPLTEAQLEAMTVTLWFKSPDNTQSDSLVNVVIDSDAQFIVQVAGNGRLRWTYEINGFSGNARHQTNSNTFSTDKWTFAAFALDHDAGTDANRVLCYVGDEDNAVSLQTNAGTQTGTPTTGMEEDSMWIGGEKQSGKKFVGEIDDVCVYSKTLTLAEITRNFNAGKRSHR